MKVTSVELHPSGSSVVIPLSYRDPSRLQPFNVKDIGGLDADEIVAKYYGVSADSNDLFFNFSMEKRDVVMRIGLNPQFTDNQSYSDLRDILYRAISSSRTGLLDIQFKDGDVVVAVVSGRFTKLVPVHFAKDPEVELTIKSDDPMLKAPNPVDVNVVGLDPSDTVIEDLISTAPHGFVFDLEFDAAHASLVITDPGSGSWSFGITPEGGFLDNDVLHFSSNPKDKQLYIVRGSDTIHLADKIDPGSMWPVIFAAVENHFALSTPATLHWDSISYYPTFWGV